MSDTHMIDDETIQVATGPLALEVDWMRQRKVPLERIQALWNELAAAYRSWEMVRMSAPKYAAYHHVHHWLINAGDRDRGPRGFFTNDIALAARFDTPDEAIEWIADRDLMHPEYPGNHERAGFTILRVK